MQLVSEDFMIQDVVVGGYFSYIGAIALLIILCMKSDEDNKYGLKPQDEE